MDSFLRIHNQISSQSFSSFTAGFLKLIENSSFFDCFMDSIKRSHSLSRDEKLKSRSLIDQLFAQGNSIFTFPFKLIYIKIEEASEASTPFLFGVTVPKRLHKLAVTRNLLKRRTREAYRKNKPKFTSESAITDRYALMYILVDKNITDTELINRSMKQINQKFVKAIQPLSNKHM